MRLVFMGTPSFAVPILSALNDKYEVVLVVTQPDSFTGRKKVLTYSPVKEFALSKGLKVFQPIKIKDDYETILEAKPDLIVTAAYGQMIPKEVLSLPTYKAINVHGSLLPKYRGGAPIQRAIMNDEPYLGVSIMRMISKMDAGKVFVQGKIPLLESDNGKTMFEKLSYLGRDLLLDSLEGILNGSIEGESQDFSKVTFAYNISHSEEQICFGNKARAIFNQVRALYDNPIAYGVINENVIKIGSVFVTDTKSTSDPGTVVSLSKELRVATEDYDILILQLQVSGKRMMEARDFLNGQHLLKLNDRFTYKE